jgi:hypothetical protein
MSLSTNVLRLAEVLSFNAMANSVDLLFLDDRSRVSDVSVLSGSASPRSGWVDYPEREPWPENAPRDPTNTEIMYCLAAVAFAGGRPMVVGFIFPPVTEMAFDPKQHPNLTIYRHPSDTHVIFQNDGSVEVVHPGGAYIKIGTDPERTDLEGEDWDRKWLLRRNLRWSEEHVETYIRARNQNTEATMDPMGNVTVLARRSLDEEGLPFEEGANITVDSTGGDITVAARPLILDGARIGLGGNITADATGGDVSVFSRRSHDLGGNLFAEATGGDATVLVQRWEGFGGSIAVTAAGGDVAITASEFDGDGGSISLTASKAVSITAGESISLVAGCVTANGSPISRIGDKDSAGHPLVEGAC